MEKAEKPKYVLRLPPCPDYDVESTECWLTDLAREGLLLKKDGLFAGVGVFERAVPQRVQYRLEAAQKDTGLLCDGYEPDPEQVELCAQYGWEYVARRGEFYIYRSHDPAARELNTDPAVQALALKAVKSRSVSAAIYAALWILVFLLAPILKRVGLLRAILELRTPVFLLFAALAVGAVVRSVRELRALRKLQRTLEQGRQPERRSGWRRNAVRCHVVRFVRLGLTAALIIASCCRITEPAQDHHPSDLEGQLPFASMQELASADGTAVTDAGNAFTWTLDEANHTYILKLFYERTEKTPDPEPTPGTGDDDVDISVSKVWKDDDSDLRPDSISVQLYRGGKAYGDEVTLSEDNDWRYTWRDLNDGYVWSVEEVDVPDGYVSKTTRMGNRWVITNTLEGTEIKDPETPTTDLPDTDVPTSGDTGTDLQNPDVPRADAPKTGDATWLWAMAAAVSGMGLVWLTISGKKRKEEDA